MYFLILPALLGCSLFAEKSPYDTASSCFVAGTRVLTPSGPRAIETLSGGDEVGSWDLELGEAVVRRVARVLRSQASATRRVEIGEFIIRGVTDEHPLVAHRGLQFAVMARYSVVVDLDIAIGVTAENERAPLALQIDDTDADAIDQDMQASDRRAALWQLHTCVDGFIHGLLLISSRQPGNRRHVW